jgi:hypothetical protein
VEPQRDESSVDAKTIVSEDVSYELEPLVDHTDGAAAKSLDERMFPPDVNAIWEEHYREQTRIDPRFTISELMLIMAVAAVALTVTRWFPPSIAAFLLGVATFCGLALLNSRSVNSRLGYLVWWTMLLVYGLFSLVAIVRG